MTTIVAVVAAMLGLTSAASAQEVQQECWVVADSTNRLGRIDMSTLTETVVGPTGVGEVETITFGPDNEILYAANAFELGTIDTATGLYAPIGPFGTMSAAGVTIAITDVDSLAWDPLRNVLWATAIVNGPDPLFQVDPTTGAVVPDVFGPDTDYVFVQGFDWIDDMDFDPITGTLFGTAKTPPDDQFMTIDPMTGATSVLPAASGVGDVEGLAFDETGVLLGTTGAIGNDPDSLYSFDTTTGVGTKVMDLGVTGGDYEGVECREIPPPALIDLELDKTVDDPTPIQGDEITFTLTLTNQGPDTATGVTVTDVLPSALPFLADDGGGAYDPASGAWTVGTLEAGASVSLVITATASEVGTFVNVTEVETANETDIDSTPGNDDGDQSEDDESSASVTVTATPLPIDLELEKTVSESIVDLGETVTYTITVANQGPGDATGVGITDAVPAGLTDISNISDGGTIADSVITWSGFSIAAGSSVAVTFDAVVTEAGGVDAYDNTAQVSTADQEDVDSTPGNDDGDQSEDDEDEEPITPIQAPVAIIGGTVWHDDDRDGIIDDAETRFGGVTVVLVGTGQTTVTDADGSYSFDVAPGSYTVEVDPTTIPAGFEEVFERDDSLDGQISVSVADNESVTDLDFGYDDLQDAYDLELTKNAGVATRNSSGIWSVGWTVTVRNNGPAIAPGPITMTDTLPAALGLVDLTIPTGWTCSTTGQVLVCVHAEDMPVGASSVFTLRTSIDADPGEVVVNPASVTSTGEETDTTNNSDSDTTAISHSPTGINAGEQGLAGVVMITVGGALLAYGGRKEEWFSA